MSGPNNVIYFPAAIIEPLDETFCWGAVVPDLPGCFSASDTAAELTRRIADAVLAWLCEATRRGYTIPRPQDIFDWVGHPDYAGHRIRSVGVNFSLVGLHHNKINWEDVGKARPSHDLLVLPTKLTKPLPPDLVSAIEDFTGVPFNAENEEEYVQQLHRLQSKPQGRQDRDPPKFTWPPEAWC